MSSGTEGGDEETPLETTASRRTVTSAGQRTPGAGTEFVTTFSNPVVVPKFGFIQDSIPVLGGPPDRGFTRSVSLVPASPYCFREQIPHRAERGYQRRIEGLDPKFSPAATDFRLVEFGDLAFNHCIMHGLDTPFYLPDPADDTRMLDVFNYHGKFTYDEVKLHIEDKIKTEVFDQYMITSLSDSAAFLLNSLDRTFQRTIRTSLNFGDARFGPLVWMKLTEEVLPNMLRRMDELETLFRSRSVKSTPGENVNVWANEQLETLHEMDANDQLPRDHLLILHKQMCSCSVEAFRVHWHGQRHTIATYVRLSAGKSKEVAAKVPGYTTYRQLLQAAKDEYGNLKEEWGPAKGTITTTAANAAALKSMKAEIKSLKSKFGGSTDAKNPLTTPKEKKAGGTGKSSSNSSGGDGGKKGEGSTETRWTRIAPKDSEPTTISKYGKSFYWCAKCKRWTQTHGTDQHKSKEEKPEAAKTAPPAANIAKTSTTPLMTGWGDSDSDSE